MDKKLKRLMNGKKVQFKHGDLQSLPHEIFNDYNSNLIMKSHMKGKGIRLELDPNESEMLGGKIKFGKIGKKISNTAKSLGHDIKDVGMDAKQYLGNTEKRQYGKKIMGAVNFQNRNLQNIANNSFVQNSPFGSTVSALANANNQGVEFLNDFHKARKEPGGLGKDLMNATKANVKRQVNTAVSSAVGNVRAGVSNAIDQGQNQAAQSLNGYWGSGLRSDVKNSLMGAYNQEKAKLKAKAREEILGGIDYMQNDGKALLESKVKNSRQYQNARNRINRGLQEGGSFRVNGGSFRVNGGALRVYDDKSPFLRYDQPGFYPIQPKSILSQKGN